LLKKRCFEGQHKGHGRIFIVGQRASLFVPTGRGKDAKEKKKKEIELGLGRWLYV